MNVNRQRRSSSEEVQRFWDANPLCASAIGHPLGSVEFFVAYDRLREANESVEFSRRFHDFESFRGQRVLDVGVGNGYVLSRYAQAGADAFGVDLSNTAVDLTRKRLEMFDLRGDVRVCPAESLPFPDDFFDGVTSTGVLHHTPDPERCFREIRRVLRPGGRFMVMLYHRDSVLYQFKFRVDAAVRGVTRAQLVDEVDGAGNPRGEVYTKAELAQLLEGFRDVHFEVGLLQRWMIPRPLRWIPEVVRAAAERRWGWFLYAKAVKA